MVGMLRIGDADERVCVCVCVGGGGGGGRGIVKGLLHHILYMTRYVKEKKDSIRCDEDQTDLETVTSPPILVNPYSTMICYSLPLRPLHQFPLEKRIVLMLAVLPLRVARLGRKRGKGLG